MIMSAPIVRAISTGKLLRVPPSTRIMLSVRTGVKKKGIDIVERMAVLMLPEVQFFSLRLTMSAATQT